MKPFMGSLCALICALSFLAYGCGSEKGSPTSQKKSTSKKPKVVEIMPLTSPEAVKAAKSPWPRPSGDPDQVEVLPPPQPGGRSITLGEINALRVAQSEEKVDPQIREVLPPQQPGKPGVTLGEINALKPTQPGQVDDPQLREVLPPLHPGEPGMTQAEINAAKMRPQDDPQLREVLPPPQTGEPGVTKGEINALGGTSQR
jgi:hypothetical protein